MKRTGCAFLLLVWTLISIADEPRQDGLESYQGKDLRKLDDKDHDALQKRFAALTGDKVEARESDEFAPWWVKPFKAGNVEWVFLKAYPGYNVPDISGVEIHAFDKDWKRVVKQTMPTGYRFSLDEVAVLRNDSLKQDLLVAKVACTGPFLQVEGEKPRPAFEQGDFQRQYYARMNDQFVLLRLEDNKGHVVRNSYRWAAPAKGQEVPKKSRDEWIRSLNSSNSVEQLATLVWLTGTHLQSNVKRQEGVSEEAVEYSKRFEDVRDAQETKKALRELANSKIPWVKEYAQMPFETPDK